MSPELEQLLRECVNAPSAAVFNDRLARLIRALPSGGGGGVTSVTGDFVDNTDPDNPVLSYQAWMATIPGYDANVDDQCVVRMANGTFKCVIVNHQ